MILTLTKTQSDILQYRLDADDAIVATLQWDGVDFSSGYHRVAIECVIDAIRQCFDHSKRIDLRPALEISEGITRAVLIDCVEGSTYFGAWSPQFEMEIIRAGDNLARKISDLFGINPPIRFPAEERTMQFDQRASSGHVP